MPSLHIEYEVCDVVSLLLSTGKLTTVMKLRVSSRNSLMGVSINLCMLMKEMFPKVSFDVFYF